MKKTVLFVILDNYSDREYPLLADALQFGIEDKKSQNKVKTLSAAKQAVHSIGGFTTIPDYCLEDVPSNYEGVVLIGGYSWGTDEARQFVPFVKEAYAKGKVVAAICKATEFLGGMGLLNHCKHTSNQLETLENAAGKNYIGRENYISEQAVRDKNLVTANGTAYLEFAKEVLLALNAFPIDYIERYYRLYRQGYIEFCKTAGNIQIFK
ncbi:DJ-1/PfpI family protein [Enterocloster clostridioformis]|uniref:DJ-1/PfpI family protein n=1 Tax=Enterocloster clostridioformis TaxID=1531 RepID=UPI0026747F4B|nr:DJ-1/PfpI family protein [Enterocloster clostridioformis]